VAIRAGLAFLRSPKSGQAESRGDLSPEAAAARTRVWAEWATEQEPADPDTLHVLARLAVDAQAVLSPEAAALVWDRVIDDVSWAEAAARHGTTPSGAKRRFQRAQRTLRRLLWDRAAALPEPARTAVLDRLRALGPLDSVGDGRPQVRPPLDRARPETRP
jgi:DNA-directed RNA polymerase specialized sigma24 family protein